MLLDLSEADPWMRWWEVNRTRFFERVFRPRAPETPGGLNPAAFRPERDRLARRPTELRTPFDRDGVRDEIETALKDESVFVRSAAALALGKIGGEGALQRLAALLEDPEVRVRETAALGLGFLGGVEARHSLEVVLAESGKAERATRESDHALSFAAMGLGLAGEVGAVPVLAETLQSSPSEEVRCAAARSLGLLGSREALSALVEVLRSNRSPEVRAYAATAIGRVGLPEGLAPLLVASRAPAKPVRRAAVLALGEIARPADVSAVDRLVEVARSDSDGVARGYAAVALGEVGGGRAWNVLVDLLAKGTGRMRPWAALGLGLHALDESPTDTAPVLREAFDAHRGDPRTGAAIAFAMGLARAKSAAAEVQAFFETLPDGIERLCTIDARILLGEKHLLPHVEYELSLAPALERSKLLALFARIHGDLVLPVRLAALAREGEQPEVATAAAFGVGYTGDRTLTKPMEKILGDEHMPPAMRAAAAFSIGTLAEEERWPLLVSVRWGEEVMEDQIETMRELRALP
jgi:HEAT repeat protein